MNLDAVIDISRPKKKIFSISEAEGLFLIIYSMTRKASGQVQELVDQLDGIDPKNEARVMILEEKINKIIQSWQTKVEKLGLRPQGLWVVDIDSGNGYYCWKYPERKINHWHGYSEGFSNRVCLDRTEKENTV